MAGEFVCETVDEHVGSDESPSEGAGGAPPDAGAPDASAGGAPSGASPPATDQQQTPDANEGPQICQEPSEPNQSIEPNVCQ